MYEAEGSQLSDVTNTLNKEAKDLSLRIGYLLKVEGGPAGLGAVGGVGVVGQFNTIAGLIIGLAQYLRNVAKWTRLNMQMTTNKFILNRLISRLNNIKQPLPQSAQDKLPVAVIPVLPNAPAPTFQNTLSEAAAEAFKKLLEQMILPLEGK